jgi:hypothetical protein
MIGLLSGDILWKHIEQSISTLVNFLRALSLFGSTPGPKVGVGSLSGFANSIWIDSIVLSLNPNLKYFFTKSNLRSESSFLALLVNEKNN